MASHLLIGVDSEVSGRIWPLKKCFLDRVDLSRLDGIDAGSVEASLLTHFGRILGSHLSRLLLVTNERFQVQESPLVILVLDSQIYSLFRLLLFLILILAVLSSARPYRAQVALDLANQGLGDW